MKEITFARFGTAIAPIITQNEVVVATDSLEVDGNLNALKNVDKIRPIGSFYMSAWGLHASDEANYDLYAIATRAFSQHGVISEMIYAFADLLSEPLSTSVEKIMRDKPNEFKEHFFGKPAVGTFVYGVDDRKLFLRSLVFYTKRRGPSIKIVLEQNNYGPDKPSNFVGSECVKKDFMRRYGVPDLMANPVAISREFVEKCIAGDGKRFGAPVQTIKVTTSSIERL